MLEDVDEPWRRPLLWCHRPSGEDDKFMLLHHPIRRNHFRTLQPSLPPFHADNVSPTAQMVHDVQRCLLAAAEQLVHIVGIHVLDTSIFDGLLLD